MKAVPAPVPLFALVSPCMRTLRSPFVPSISNEQPLTVSVPRPLAIATPLEQTRSSPVIAFTNTTFLGLESSCKQKLHAFTPNVHCVMLLDPSVAVQITVVVPTGNIDPDGGLHTTAGFAVQLSVATGVAKLAETVVANGHDACATVVTSPGQPLGNTGGWVSFTVTVKLQFASAGTLLLAVQFTVLLPT
jgi:hypothetical protein